MHTPARAPCRVKYPSPQAYIRFELTLRHRMSIKSLGLTAVLPPAMQKNSGLTAIFRCKSEQCRHIVDLNIYPALREIGNCLFVADAVSLSSRRPYCKIKSQVTLVSSANSLRSFAKALLFLRQTNTASLRRRHTYLQFSFSIRRHMSIKSLGLTAVLPQANRQLPVCCRCRKSEAASIYSF